MYLKYLAFRDYHACEMRKILELLIHFSRGAETWRCSDVDETLTIIATSGDGWYEIHLYLFTTKTISRSEATRKLEFFSLGISGLRQRARMETGLRRIGATYDHTRRSRVEALLSPGYQNHIYGLSDVMTEKNLESSNLVSSGLHY